MAYNAERMLSSPNPTAYDIIHAAADMVGFFGPTSTSLRSDANIAYEMCYSIF